MTLLTTAHATSTATPEQFFAAWADMATWPEWNPDTAWVRLDGDFVEGATGTLKPRGGPRVPFTIERLVPGERFLDVSRLLGARLAFDHTVTRTPEGTLVEVVVTLTGPLRRLWDLVLGSDIRSSTQRDLETLADRLEASASAA